MIRVIFPQGIYEWVIARTKYIDDMFIRASSKGFSQVLLFGAGFDTRSIRFQSELQGAKFFELDAPTTQNAKIEQYRKRGIPVPNSVVFVPINFEKESAADRLQDSGFCKGLKSLVIMEGVLQYLKREAAHATLQIIKDQVGKGSWLIFDYAYESVLRGDGKLYGEDRMTKGIAKFGESWQFGLEEHDVEAFLEKYGFRVLDRKSPKDLEETYFRNENGIVIGRVNGTQSIIMAEKV